LRKGVETKVTHDVGPVFEKLAVASLKIHAHPPTRSKFGPLRLLCQQTSPK